MKGLEYIKSQNKILKDIIVANSMLNKPILLELLRLHVDMVSV